MFPETEKFNHPSGRQKKKRTALREKEIRRKPFTKNSMVMKLNR